MDMVGIMLKTGWFDTEELKITNQTSDDLALFAKGASLYDHGGLGSGCWSWSRILSSPFTPILCWRTAVFWF